MAVTRKDDGTYTLTVPKSNTPVKVEEYVGNGFVKDGDKHGKGVKFAKAEEPQDREKAKGALKNAIIGFGLIFVLLIVLKLLMPIMTNWVKNYPTNNSTLLPWFFM